MDSLHLNERLEQQANAETEADTASVFLKRMLSIKFVISTSSSFAQTQQVAVGTKSMVREIGTGSIGKVFKHPETISVYNVPVYGAMHLFSS